MTKAERRQLDENVLNIYSGILFHNQQFAQENSTPISYDFSCPEYQELKEKYQLEKIAGKGSDFTRSKRLMHYLAPRLTHCSWYDNHVPCNSLALLEYSLNNKEQGINCLNKSKILEECCLALGIYARRVKIMPYSPYDYDNHVVTEIYDRKLRKWIMLDPTTDGYFVDENKMPLSLLELREKFANKEFATFVRAINRLQDLKKWAEKYTEINMYICKNLFYFVIGQECRFGLPNHFLTFCPENYSVRNNLIGNAQYRIKCMPEEHKNLIAFWEKQLEEIKNSPEVKKTGIEVMRLPPVK